MTALIIRSVVLFPQPLGPTAIIVFPPGASRSRPSTATVPSGYCLVTCSKVITATRP